MKKTGLVLLLAVFIATGAFAQEGGTEGMSFGIGAYFDGSFGNGLKFTGKSPLGDLFGDLEKTSNDNISIGGFIFFDIKYAEISAGFAYGSIKPSINGSNEFGGYKIGHNDGFLGFLLDFIYLGAFGVAEMEVWQMNFSILGKYPINLGPLALYPLVGLDYNRIISGTMRMGGEIIKFEGQKPESEEEEEEGDLDWLDKEVSAFSQFGILAGLGLDISFGSKIYLRVQALYNLRLPNDFQSTVAKEIWKGEAKATLGHGPRFKVGVGFRL